MKVIVFAASKGGTGKTTLCYNTSIFASRDHSVLVGDLDPQKSLKELWEKRGDLTNPRLVSNMDSVVTSVKLLKEAGYDRDYLMIDLPGSLIRVIRDACACADLIVLPVQPSPMDLTSQEAMFDMVETMGKNDRTMFVLNRVEGRSDLKEKALEFLQIRTRLPIPVIASRADYMRAAWDGKAGCEINKQADKEIAGLWKAINNAMKLSENGTQEVRHERRVH